MRESCKTKTVAYAIKQLLPYYKTNGNKVPKTDGAKPIMNLPNELPDDINYEWYTEKIFLHCSKFSVMKRDQRR